MHALDFLSLIFTALCVPSNKMFLNLPLGQIAFYWFYIMTFCHAEELFNSLILKQSRMSGLISFGIAHMKTVFHCVPFPLRVSSCVCSPGCNLFLLQCLLMSLLKNQRQSVNN